jgi:hypothetical protein
MNKNIVGPVLILGCCQNQIFNILLLLNEKILCVVFKLHVLVFRKRERERERELINSRVS